MIAFACAVCLLGLAQGSAEGMDEARSLIRQGRLTLAEERLDALGRLPEALMESSRELLLGNIDFERGDYSSARSHYLESLELMDSAGATAEDPRVNAARMNLGMSENQLARQVYLRSAASSLRLAVGALLAIGTFAVGLFFIRSRTRGDPAA